MAMLTGLKHGTTGELIPVKVDADGRLVIAGVTLEAGTVNVGSEVEVKNDQGNPIPVTGPVTDAQLRASPVPVSATGRTCVGRQTITGLSTTTPATLTVPNGAVSAMIQADGGTVRLTLEGTAPTATLGFKVEDASFFYVDTPLATVKLLAAAASTNVQIAYFDKA